MQLVMFTKMFRGIGLDEMAGHIKALGFDGVDLLIRNGHQVEPSAPEKIGAAVARIRQLGLTVPMATTDLNEASPVAERVLAACREAGIGAVRLGYYPYRGSGYAEALAQARAALDGLEALAAKTGIQLLIQLHGDTIHASGGQTVRLLEGRDPRHVAVYPDPGNQTVQDGRDDWRFTFDVLKPWLACVGVKNGGWMPGSANAAGQRVWSSDWFGLADGMVRWDEIVAHLKATGFDGLLTLHSHYEVPLAQAIDQTRTDLNYIRALIGAAA